MKKYLIVVFCFLVTMMSFACAKSEAKSEAKSKFEYNLSMDELRLRTSEDRLTIKKFLDVDAKEYSALAEGDKKALSHLVKAAKVIEKIEYQIDNAHNLEVLEWLTKEEKNGSEQAKLTKELFVAQQGVNAIDRLSQDIKLIKNIDKKKGMGAYPEDLTVEEFHNILFKMLDENKIDEVRDILNQRSMVVRDGDELKAIDYVEYFKEDFENVANELIEASKTSTDKDFNEFLLLQADALKTADPMLDAKADIKWATLQYTPLEFTITRESYYDTMTSSVIENEKLYSLVKEKGIDVITKDNLGCRVGIVNKEGTDFLLSIKKYLPVLAANMPYNNEYKQIISDTSDIKQSMVDIDMVISTGESGQYRGSITQAENLPNDDKLAIKLGGGKRNAYHRQIRFEREDEYQRKIDAILDKEQHQYYDPAASHCFVIGHENTHSLGPKTNGSNGLGKYRSIIEENKADMGSMSFIDILTDQGMYDDLQRKKIIVTIITNFFVKSKPDFSQAHKVRNVMQIKHLYDYGAIDITNDGKIHVNIDKAVPAARAMLEEIIRIQLDQNLAKAEKYVNDNFVWTDYMETIGQKIQQTDKGLNGKIDMKLAEKLMLE